MGEKKKLFIDGREGTTGLRIYERLADRDDIVLLTAASDLRKDPAERKRLINASDITILCLPDEAAKESVSLVENEEVVVIDASTAHRTAAGWAYGFPELSSSHREAVRKGKRIAVPGCYATGFISLIYPMIEQGLLPSDYPVSAFGLSGYSGAGKKVIAAYEDSLRPADFDAPREYALTQSHKHLKEMKQITGLKREPLFSPVICDYYNGMVLSVPLYTELLSGVHGPLEAYQALRDFYGEEKLIRVKEPGAWTGEGNMLAGNGCAGWDGLNLFVTGNEERILLSAQFDNLGKGASGAAVQCLNLVMGCEEEKGLSL